MFRQARLTLVAELRVELAEVIEQAGLSLSVEPVLSALAKVPRHEFVPEPQVKHAYRNRPLPTLAA